MKGKIIRIICMQIILAMLVLSIGCGGKSFVGNEVTSESRETISTELKSTNSSIIIFYRQVDYGLLYDWAKNQKI